MKEIAALLRRYILEATTVAGSGHPTSSLSAVELMTVLFFGGVYRENDRVIFSKGHAAPLLYALYTVSGDISYTELMGLRRFDSNLEGHPTKRFPFTQASTGSLGQGLSIGAGIALAQSRERASTIPHTFVLLGDSELSEGQIWEAVQWAGYRQLAHLVAVVDINRLGQQGETMLRWDLATYAQRFASFGWQAITVDDGHDIDAVTTAYRKALAQEGMPSVIIAKTIKGKGVSFLENKEEKHGKALNQEELKQALSELGPKPAVRNQRIPKAPPHSPVAHSLLSLPLPHYRVGDAIATREAYGDSLLALGENTSDVLALDAEVSNSTYSEKFKQAFPERFLQMYIAEQHMISTAVGLASCGYVPCASTFAAFLSRAFDQIRMAQYSDVPLMLAGSHAGVSIGEDGPSQMGLEDIAMMRTIHGATIVYPSDATATYKLMQELYNAGGISYMRLTRAKTPVLYPPETEFPLGGLHVIGNPQVDNKALIIAAGITLHEALNAQRELLEQYGIHTLVIDLYSIEPMDEAKLVALAREIPYVITVEDHVLAGGIGEAVTRRLVNIPTHVYTLAVGHTPRSGSMQELLAYEGIDARAIISKITSLVNGQ